MLNKRYQVLLSNWMEDYLKFITDRYDLNFSSAIRVHMCLGILYIISNLEPDYKIDLKSEDLVAFSKNAGKGEMTEEMVTSCSRKSFLKPEKLLNTGFRKKKRKKNKRGYS
ncbi:MAG: hypothetical protein JSV17_00060 [Candidatus Aminicenantes bacterium]|nr:MAG: hypothetical protein JSV17_00060 [Candidatus Aminicenantes bacterium]